MKPNAKTETSNATTTNGLPVVPETTTTVVMSVEEQAAIEAAKAKAEKEAQARRDVEAALRQAMVTLTTDSAEALNEVAALFATKTGRELMREIFPTLAPSKKTAKKGDFLVLKLLADMPEKAAKPLARLEAKPLIKVAKAMLAIKALDADQIAAVSLVING